MARKTRKRSKTDAPEQPKAASTRRDAIRKLAIWGGVGAVTLGGGTVFALDFTKKIQELDLSVIGQGTPVIVQIHDPQCALCTELQRQTRSALRSFSDEQVLYRVANVRTEEGAAHQAREGVPHVTLVLYDAGGARVHVVQGVTPAERLVEAFAEHLKLAPKSA